MTAPSAIQVVAKRPAAVAGRQAHVRGEEVGPGPILRHHALEPALVAVARRRIAARHDVTRDEVRVERKLAVARQVGRRIDDGEVGLGPRGRDLIPGVLDLDGVDRLETRQGTGWIVGPVLGCEARIDAHLVGGRVRPRIVEEMRCRQDRMRPDDDARPLELPLSRYVGQDVADRVVGKRRVGHRSSWSCRIRSRAPLPSTVARHQSTERRGARCVTRRRGRHGGSR